MFTMRPQKTQPQKKTKKNSERCPFPSFRRKRSPILFAFSFSFFPIDLSFFFRVSFFFLQGKKFTSTKRSLSFRALSIATSYFLLLASTSPRAGPKIGRRNNAPATLPPRLERPSRTDLARACIAGRADGRQRPCRRSRCGLRCVCPVAGSGSRGNAVEGRRQGPQRRLVVSRGRERGRERERDRGQRERRPRTKERRGKTKSTITKIHPPGFLRRLPLGPPVLPPLMKLPPTPFVVGV